MGEHGNRKGGGCVWSESGYFRVEMWVFVWKSGGFWVGLGGKYHERAGMIFGETLFVGGERNKNNYLESGQLVTRKFGFFIFRNPSHSLRTLILYISEALSHRTVGGL